MAQLVVANITVTDATVRVVTIGTTGTSGFSGFSGRSGASGYSGFSAASPGASGFSGFSGFSGANPGASGFSGFSGKSGYSGYSGVGTSGFSGFSGIGTSGFSGFSGISGFSGFSGVSGFSGFSGTSGYSGFSGRSGYSGYSGYSGFSGISGYSGFSGVSGYSGFSGISGYSGFSSSGNVTAGGTLTSTALVTGVGGSAIQTPSATTTLDVSGNMTVVGRFIDSVNGALSAPAVAVSGTPITGGTGTTTFPLFDINSSGAAASTTLNTAGTMFRVNAPSGFTGTLADFQVNGAGTLKIDNTILYAQEIRSYTGTNYANLVLRLNSTSVDLNSTSVIKWPSGSVVGTADTTLSRNTAGVVQVGTTAANVSGAILANAHVAGGGTPSVSSGTILTGSKNNAGGVTSATTGIYSGIITFTGYTAATGWNVSVWNMTAGTAMFQTASSTTTATISGATTTGDIIRYIAIPF